MRPLIRTLGLLSCSFALQCSLSGDDEIAASHARGDSTAGADGEGTTSAPGAGVASSLPPPPSSNSGDGGSGAPSTDGSSPTTPPSNVASHRVHGRISVRTLYSGVVYLGDGSKFMQAAPGDFGSVTFDDPSLQGPQTVTFVWPADSYRSLAYTVVAIDQDEVWLGPPHHTRVNRATVHGALTGNVSDALLYVAGEGDLPVSPQAGGGYTFVQSSPALESSPIDLLAVTRANGAPAYAGIVTGVAVPTTTNGALPSLTIPPIAVDRPFDRAVSVTIDRGADATPTVVEMEHLIGGRTTQFVQWTSGPVGTSASFSTFDRSPPFDTVGAYVSTQRGPVDGVVVEARAPVASDGTATLKVPASAPSFSFPQPSASYADRSTHVVTLTPGSQFAWTGVDPEAQVVDLRFEVTPLTNPTTGVFIWEIELPASQTTFTLPAPPAAMPNVRLAPGEMFVSITARAFGLGTMRDEVHGHRAPEQDMVGRLRGVRSATRGGWLLAM